MKKIKVIYILGTSYSGSTLLGYILHGSKEIFNLGELKNYERACKNEKKVKCSCGLKLKECHFWLNFLGKYQNIYKMPNIFEKIKTVLKIILGIKFSRNKISETNDYSLLNDFYHYFKKERDSFYLLDTSKSLWRLIYLMNCSEIELKIIYLQRDIYGNVFSFVKHKQGFLKGLFIYKFKNFLIRKFLKVNNINFVKVDYKELCTGTKNTLAKISRFLDIDPDFDLENIAKNNCHIFFPAMKGKMFSDGFEIRHDLKWKSHLSKTRQIILKILS